MNDLIDTTEMYLRTIFELEEEGAIPLRARIVERLHQSGPTVSQTVARMQRDGLVNVLGDRQLELTPEGRRQATAVMRKHRLAELFLVEVLGLEWEKVHAEACRWEHVISTDVERRIVEMVGDPSESPYGNPIPGLEELGQLPARAAAGDVTPLRTRLRAGDSPTTVTVRRLSEGLQSDPELIEFMATHNIRPGSVITAAHTDDVLQINDQESDLRLADFIFVDSK